MIVVAADLGFGADVSMRRIDKRHTAFDHQTPNRRAPYEVLKLRQLSPRIDPINFARLAVQINTDLAAVFQDDCGHVRQIVLTLIVRRLDLAQRLKSSRASKQ